MVEARRVHFDVKIRRRDVDKLERAKMNAMAKSDIYIQLTHQENPRTSDVHIEINGDKHQAAAFKDWVHEFALHQPA